MALPALQSIPLFTWFKLVNDTVTEPYLDEVFHVRQAQHYCHNNFEIWDPKITTPPGLYLLSYLISPIVGCDLVWLRCLNMFCLVTLQAVVTWTYVVRRSKAEDDWTAQHNALNVTLFPPLFFVAALYYTDVPSTLAVLTFYWLFLHFNRSGTSSWLRIPALVVVGIASLLFRQTNIFWVAVFPAALVLVNKIDLAHDAVKESMYRQADGFGDSWISILKTSWKMEAVYDPTVGIALTQDYAKTTVSIMAICLKLVTKPKRAVDLLQALSPFMTIAAAFATFVIWNGSVVLGDKGNHVATLHLTQMLYIWPYITFFSWPLVYPYLVILPFLLAIQLPGIATLDTMLAFRARRKTPHIWQLAAFVAVACAIVRFKTIVHPFTLADNRHYTFYVFRLLTKPWWIKYAASPIYIVCGWACIQALGASVAKAGGSGSLNKPAKDSSPPSDKADAKRSGSPKSLTLPSGYGGATTSFVLIWLATSTLQLATAPLVEPRYFILPWIFWRIHVPIQQSETPTEPKAERTLRVRLTGVDHRLWVETAWLLLINAGTGYMFLYRGFSWPQEPGMVQRFMW